MIICKYPACIYRCNVLWIMIAKKHQYVSFTTIGLSFWSIMDTIVSSKVSASSFASIFGYMSLIKIWFRDLSCLAFGYLPNVNPEPPS